MKTKVFMVDPPNRRKPTDDFRMKIDYRLAAMQERRNVMRNHISLNDLEETRDTEFCSRFMGPIQNGIEFTEGFVKSEEFLSLINSAMELQQECFETVLTTNRVFNIQLLFIFLEAFLSILFHCYYIISVIVEPKAFKLSQKDSLLFLTENLMEPCIFVSMIVIGFEGIRVAIRRIQRTVNKNVIHARSDRIKTTFLAFSQQIQSNTMRFSVYGFFPLDGSVLFSMISATTTYLIILLQTLGGRSVIDPHLIAAKGGATQENFSSLN